MYNITYIISDIHTVIFIVGTKYYVIIKPKRESARLFLDIPLCVAVSIISLAHDNTILMYNNIIYMYYTLL